MSGKNSKINQFSKSTSSMPHREFPVATSTFSRLVILLPIFLGFLGASNTYASSISVSISGEMNLDLLASDVGMFGTSTPATISVVSSNSSGYTLTLTGDRNDGRLVGSNPNNYFTSITGPLTETEFNTSANNGKWGILPSKYNSTSNTSYQPAPTNTNPVTMDTTNAANYSPNTYTLAVAARASTGAGSFTLADEYTGTFTLAATGNAIDYDIAYVDDLAGLPGLTFGSSSTGTATLSNTEPTKPGYEFAGWCTTEVALGAACTGTTYAAGSNYTLSSGDNNVTLHAIWAPITFAEAFGSTAMTMQNMTSDICSQVAVGQEATLTDTRNGSIKSYKVGKMKDDHCWMLDNLQLGGNNTIALTPDDTNITSNWTLPASTSSGFDSFTVARINTSYNTTVPTDSMSTRGGWMVGTYYNYCAASAGTYCPASDAASTVVSQDICPKGWRMPSGGPGGEYQAIWNIYENNITNFRTVLRLPLSGYFASGRVYDQGDSADWWSNVYYKYDRMYAVNATSTRFNPLFDYDRRFGFSMRCVAK